MALATVPYRDSTLSIDERVGDLLGRMTREEKVAQLGSLWGFELVLDGSLRQDRVESLLADGLGEITRLAGATNLGLLDAARIGDEIQRYLVERTRLGIPAIIHEESLHGVLACDAPVFQQSIGAAATFDPALVERVATTLRRRLLAFGARHALAPVLDLARDPRWGRIEETYGEDPYLAAVMGIAYVRGIQGPSRAEGVIATAKHLVGHGMSEGGRNQGPVHVGWRELRDEQLVPFEAAVCSAGIGSVMPAYCEVDGVPCHASTELLTSVLRGEWGFEGVVSSDYIGIEQLLRQHQLTDDMGTAGAMALHAGVDQELPRTVAYGRPLLEALAAGRASEVDLDAAVSRVLRAKFELGLFERPYAGEPSRAELDQLAADERTVGAELARRSLVLVENDGILPLASDLRRIAVVGPIADSARDLLGDYSHLLHIETLLEIQAQHENALGFDVTNGSDGVGDLAALDELDGKRTILDALRDRFADAEVRFAPGTGIDDGTDAGIGEAVEEASRADVVIAVLGERSGLTIDSTTGEFRDRRDLGLVGRQQELLEALVATGRPVVLVLVSGRPLAIEWAQRHCAAILIAWVPGDLGPDAIADVLTGATDPGGKLPVTFPRHVGQVPVYFGRKPSGGRSHPRGDYVDGSVQPLWPFGFGRTYTSFELSELAFSSRELATDGGEVDVRVAVTNVGERAGDEVVQMYLRDEEAQVARPMLSLGGFARVRLEPGERRVVTFSLSAEQLAYTGHDYRRIVEPGTVTVSVGTSSGDRPLSGSLALVGLVVEVPVRRRFVTPTTTR
jgi:beta-glucosidase